MSPRNRIKIRLVGMPEDDRSVRVGPFLAKLDAMRKALRATDRVISEGEQQFDYRVIDLTHQSPPTVELEAVPLEMEAVADSTHLIDTFYATVVGIQEAGTIPEGFGYADLQKFKSLQPVKGAVPEVVISRNGDEVSLAVDWSEKVENVLGPDQYAIGSVTGMLQQLNVHGNNRKFTIYPTFGEPALRCGFDKELRDKVVNGVDRYVRVSGTLHYKAGSWYPHAIDATDVETFPPESQLPTLDDLFGIEPDLTGGEAIEDFVRKARDAWE